LREIAERHSTPGIDFIDVEVQSFDLGPSVRLFRKVFYQPDRNLAFDTIAVRLSGCTKE
jgi:hypothetical protein